MQLLDRIKQSFLPKPPPSVSDITPPTGFRENEKGHLVPEHTIKEIDLERDKLVNAAFEQTQVLQATMEQYKEWIYGEVQAFLDKSAEQYGVELPGHKGNVTLFNFNRTIKVVVRVATEIRFTEQLQSAQKLIDEWIEEKSVGVDSELLLLIQETFVPNREGNISAAKLFRLMRYNFSGEKWNRAMTAVKDSIMPTDKKQYIRVYERIPDDNNVDGKWQMMNINLGYM